MKTKIKYTRHGHYHTLLYKKWMGMKRRCLNKRDTAYERYGGRGITICDKWMNFMGFHEDMSSSFKAGLSLERINNDKGYFKENCKWIPMKEQAKNKRSVKLYDFKGRKVSLGELEKEYGLSRGYLHYRVKKIGFNKTLEFWANLLK